MTMCVCKDTSTPSNRKHSTNIYLSLRMSCLEAGCPELEWRPSNATQGPGIFSLPAAQPMCLLSPRASGLWQQLQTHNSVGEKLGEGETERKKGNQLHWFLFSGKQCFLRHPSRPLLLTHWTDPCLMTGCKEGTISFCSFCIEAGKSEAGRGCGVSGSKF